MARIHSPLEQLLEAVTTLGAPPERQLEELMRLGPGLSVTDLAAAFDDALTRFVWHRWPIVPLESWEALEALDEQLTGMAADPSLWTPTALCAADDWQLVRRAAIRALSALSAPAAHLEPPAGRRARC